MVLTAVSIQGYRSIRRLYLPIGDVSLFVGGNGVGKTNLYNGLALLRGAADGTIVRAIAEEGGVTSVLWAGPRRKGPVRLKLRAQIDNLDYAVEIGLGAPGEGPFASEPRIKEERLVIRAPQRGVVMMERKNATVMLRNADGARENHSSMLLPSETALAAFRDGVRYPELEAVRRELLGWRLYHDFRTDVGAPVRRPCHAIATPTLSADGHDLAAVLGTLKFIREDTVAIDRAIDDAFPGSRLHVEMPGGSLGLAMTFPDLPGRAFAAHELSDGTLKYLCLLGALMGYRLPPLVALNEPEASLHPSLLGPLARLIAQAAQNTRLWVVTHSEMLAAALEAEAGAVARRVIKVDGETRIEGQKADGEFVDDDDEDQA